MRGAVLLVTLLLVGTVASGLVASPRAAPGSSPRPETRSSDGPAPRGVPVETFTADVWIPPGKQFSLRFDPATASLLPDAVEDAAGLDPTVLSAIDRAPAWLEQNLTRKFSALSAIDIDAGDSGAPAVGDFDGDGDLDLVVGGQTGSVTYYRNEDGGLHYEEGYDYTIAAVYRVDAALGLSIASTYADPAVGDIDGDGDLDLLVGANDGSVYRFRNTGTPTNPAFAAQGFLSGVTAGSRASPDLADMDADGDADLILGGAGGTLQLYANSAGSFSFVAGYFGSIDVGANSAPAAGDLDGDGDFDLAVGKSGAGLDYYRNTGTPASGTWASNDATFFSGIDSGGQGAPMLKDLDADLVPDLAVGIPDGRARFWPNRGTATSARWIVWSLATTTFNALNMDGYYEDDANSFLRHRTATTRALDYANTILAAPQTYVDEIAFALAHATTASLTHPSVYSWGASGALDNLLYNNTDALYHNDQYAAYADIVDYDLGTPDQWSTVRYKVNNSGVIETREYPRYVYYWWVVMPKGSDELATFINPVTSARQFSGHEGAAPRSSGGYFWRWAAFNLARSSYWNDPTSCVSQDDPSDLDGDGNFCRNYPSEENPPILRQKIAAANVMWDLTTYSTQRIYNVTGEWARDGNNQLLRPWGLTDQAVEIVGHWVGSTVPLHAQDSDEGNRPRQAVTVQWEMNGNCGEEGDLMTAGLRSALVAARTVDGYGGDHCFAEFYESGWHQFDTYWHGDTTIVANDDNYHYGWNRDWSGLVTYRGDSQGINIVDRYHHAEDASVDTTGAYSGDPNNEGILDRANVTVTVRDPAGNPVDGAKVALADWLWLNYNPSCTVTPSVCWITFGTVWYYTGPDGKITFATSEARQNSAPSTPWTSDTYDDGILLHVASKLGGGPMNSGYGARYKVGYGDGVNPRNAAMNNFQYTVSSTVPRPSLQTSAATPPTPGRYRLDASFQVLAGVQRPANAQGLDDGTAYHDVEHYTGVTVDACVLREAEYPKLLKGQSFAALNASANAASGSLSRTMADGETWRFVLSNQDTFQTAKVVRVTVDLVDTSVDGFTFDFDDTMLGRRLISFPVVPQDPSTPGVLSSLDGSYAHAAWYDAGDATDGWKAWRPGGGDLSTLDETKGFWIEVTQPGRLVVIGTYPTSTDIPLKVGWNLVGFPSLRTDYTVGMLKAATSATRVEGFDGAAGPYYLRAMGDGEFLAAGNGYWVYAPTDVTWTVAF